MKKQRRLDTAKESNKISRQATDAVVVLLSGGLDSCVAATLEAQNPHALVSLFSIYYGQGGFAEMVQAEQIANHLFDTYPTVIRHFQMFIGGRARLDKNNSIDERKGIYEKFDRIDQKAMGFETSIVSGTVENLPGYGGIRELLSSLSTNEQALDTLANIVAGSLANAQGFVGWRSPKRGYSAHGLPNGYPSTRDEAFTLLGAAGVEAMLLEYHWLKRGRVVLSTTNDDIKNFPDINPDTYTHHINTILAQKEVPRRYEKPIYVKLPLINLTKDEVVKIGKAIQAPIELSWSCYFGEPNKPCYTCDQCEWRIEAFGKAGIKDPLYERTHKPSKEHPTKKIVFDPAKRFGTEYK